MVSDRSRFMKTYILTVWDVGDVFSRYETSFLRNWYGGLWPRYILSSPILPLLLSNIGKYVIFATYENQALA